MSIRKRNDEDSYETSNGHGTHNGNGIDEYSTKENPTKKFKTSQVNTIKNEVINLPKIKVERCVICKQYSDEVVLYNGHPNNSVEEYITLTDDRLMIFNGDEADLNERDERPTHKITHFSVYDKNGHLCPFDTGLIEENKLLYFSGYVKPIYEEDTSTENGIATKDMGPINEWFISGFDGGEKALIGFCTAYAEYYLQEPSVEYQPIMKLVAKKIYLAKIIIEFLLDEGYRKPTYEDLLQRLEATGDPELTEETLLRHAQFVCDKVTSFDATSSGDEPLLITCPCMRALVKMAGVTFQKRQNMRKIESKGIRQTTASKWSKATTTNLVRDVFETFFRDQIDKKEKSEKDDKGPRRKRCGVCEPCQTPDCGKCSYCCAMLKFGGAGRTKQACQKRRCPYMEIEDADEESGNEDDHVPDTKVEGTKAPPCSRRIIHQVKWIGEAAMEYNKRLYYKSAQVGDIVVKDKDYVMLYAEDRTAPLQIAQITYMWEEPLKGPMFHAHLFCRGTDTILGLTADPRELYMVDVCEKYPLGSIVRTAEVELRKFPGDWALNGGLDSLPPQLEDNGKSFFYSKRYDSYDSRFEEIVEDQKIKSDFSPCSSCRRNLLKKKTETPKFKDGDIHWWGDIYRIGSAVFLEPDAFTLKIEEPPSIDQYKKDEAVDEELYPEFYRKPAENRKGSNIETPEPFSIGLIEDIIQNGANNIIVKVRKFYRPEHTRNRVHLASEVDWNLLYWSSEEYKVDFKEVTGKCYVAFGDALEISAEEWSKKGPYRFYFIEGYDCKADRYIEIPPSGTKIGISKGKGKGKGKANKPEVVFDVPPVWEHLKNPLKCMDVFAGCGGLSEGFHQAGIAETKWAIEKEAAAARAFKLNNPDATVYTDDCNELLRIVMSGEDKAGKTLPRKGEVEMLVGGPPCQGFSGMNRFNAGQYSLFKNSLIVSYLSYCDYYRPAYFILENVRNFVSFKRSMVLKLTIRCLLAIGYQVTFGVVQAGHYGVPQTRRRLIIMAAAPGYVLPRYPEPQHVFNKVGCQLSIPLDSFRYFTGVRWWNGAPYRTISVRDAMSDLPDIKNGESNKEMSYGTEPLTHFQRIMRGNEHDPSCIVTDHICKEMAPLVAARMAQVPLAPGSDWRDLPNIVVRLSDGVFSNKLKYPYRTKKQKKTDPPRGVCRCAASGGCDNTDRQFNTLIPWCLPHTADRHNHWAGLYGRLEWDGFFSTTVTNPEPMGKQGRVLHPEQHRVVSVRECARSQGFPDRYQFYGNILDKHRQVGNAVPPPLGAALGREIKKALIITENNRKKMF